MQPKVLIFCVTGSRDRHKSFLISRTWYDCFLECTNRQARRYDSRTTIFSPEGRLFQVEYAMEAISHAGTAVGILTKDGVVLAAEKKVTSQLLESTGIAEKMYKIDEHIVCAVAGITADANILVNYARTSAQQFTYQFQEPTPVEGLPPPFLPVTFRSYPDFV